MRQFTLDYTAYPVAPYHCATEAHPRRDSDSVSFVFQRRFLPGGAAQFRGFGNCGKGWPASALVDAAKVWLEREARAGGFAIDYIEDTNRIDDAFLAKYRVFLQVNYPPYRWDPTAIDAFRKYIEEGRGGWIGFHHATLLGEFDGYAMWPWFSMFMGGIRFATYIPTFATGTVTVEAPAHPVMQGVASSFTIENEEWYTYDKSPRTNVHVLASVDEKSYAPPSSIRMGDHPVIWSNERMKARNVYLQMGHHGELFQNPTFAKIVHNSILWVAGQ